MPSTPARATNARPKRVLVIHYSQTGQLGSVARQIVSPLQSDPNVEVHEEVLRPVPAYPFPWPFFEFFDAFPESAHMVPPSLAPLSLTGEEDFDLIILAYQVWFLAPSLPITAFLKHPVAHKLLTGKPVVSVIACRNMWLMAHEKFKTLLSATGARLIDNAVLTDPGNTFATFLTTPVWLLSGRKKGFWGLRDAGISPEQVHGTRRFGLALLDALRHDREKLTGPLLSGLGAVQAEPALLLSEMAGTRSFYLWGKLIMALSPPRSTRRKPLLAIYVVFLLAMIVTVVPISLSLQALLRPLLRKRMNVLKSRFELPSGSATNRSHMYEN